MAFFRGCLILGMLIASIQPSVALADDKRLDIGIKSRSIPLAPPAKPAGLRLLGLATGQMPTQKSAPVSDVSQLAAQEAPQPLPIKALLVKPLPVKAGPVNAIKVGDSALSVAVLKVTHQELDFSGPASPVSDDLKVRLGATQPPKKQPTNATQPLQRLETPTASGLTELRPSFATVTYIEQGDQVVPQIGSKPVSLAAFKGLELKPQDIALFVDPKTILPENKPEIRPGVRSSETKAVARAQRPKQLAPPPKPTAAPPALRPADGSCFAKLQALGASFSRVDPFRTPKGCGMNGGVMLKSVGGIDIVPDAQLDCPFALRIARWVGGDLNQTVTSNTGAPLKSVRHYSAYRCTFRSKGRLSEHATGNAFDLAGLETTMGTKMSVLKDWGDHMNWAKMEPMSLSRRKEDMRPTVKAASQKDGLSSANRQVWYEVTKSACKDFQLVLTPHSNKAHANHLHIDQGRWKQCEL